MAGLPRSLATSMVSPLPTAFRAKFGAGFPTREPVRAGVPAAGRRLRLQPKTESPEQPKGELVVQTIAMPKDTNPNGDIFGGWLMSQMDLGSGILAAKTAKARVVTRQSDAAPVFEIIAERSHAA